MTGQRSRHIWMVMVLLTAVSLAPGQNPPPTTLVTIPTAGTLARGEYEVELLMQTGGGILGRLAVGFSNRFTIGMSYGVSQFIGDKKIGLNRIIPEAQLKYRLLDETQSLPALSIGIDSQGRGGFWEQDVDIDSLGVPRISMARYDVKAIGGYLVASKNWQILGNFGTHFGISKNFMEQDESDDDINVFFGIDHEMSPSVVMFAEYNAAWDDNENKDHLSVDDLAKLTVGQGSGYLNAGLRLTMAPGLYLEIDLNDILLNKGRVKNYTREMKVNFVTFF